MPSFLQIKNVSKQFGGVYALNNVSFTIDVGTIHALVGENGAGKSTLMNILSGVIPFGTYDGKIKINGELCSFANTHNSEKCGISAVHQELSLVPDLSIAENIFLGNERRRSFGRVNWDATYSQSAAHMKKVGLDDNPSKLVKELNVGKQQLVEIAKALAKDVKILILDEPTSSLNEINAKKLLDIIVELKKQGVTVILISHKLPEIIAVSDNITILRDGSVVETIQNSNHDVDQNKFVPKMVGRELVDLYPKRLTKPGHKVIFDVKNYSVEHPYIEGRKTSDDVSFNLKENEMVGFYGLQGSGRTELALSLFGNSYGKKLSGDVFLDGHKVDFVNKRQAIDAGFAYVTEDRKSSGLLFDQSVKVNTTLANLSKLANKISVINKAQEVEVAKSYAQKLNTKINSINQNTEALSGGNQQKVLLSKWLYTNPKVLVLDEPTRGIDVGAKYEIYKIMNEMVESDRGIIIISSELPELLGMCDRIYAMREGKIVGEFDADDATEEIIIQSIFQEE